MRYQVCFLFFFCMIHYLKAQNLIVQYTYHKDAYLTDSFEFPLQKTFEKNVLSKTRLINPVRCNYFTGKDSDKTICSFYINDTSCYLFGDGFGHEIILFPDNDTVMMRVDFPNKLQSENSTSFFIPWFHNLTYTSKNKYIYEIFDSLNINEGSPLYDKVSFKGNDMDIGTFFNLCKSKYKKRQNYLNGYCSKYKVPDNVKQLVLQEIKSGFLINIITPLANNIKTISKNEYPKEYLDSLKNLNFDSILYFQKTKLYSEAAYLYAVLYLSKKETDFTKLPSTTQMYEVIKTNYSGEIRDYCLTNMLSSSINNNSSNFDSLINDYSNFCIDKNVIVYLDSLNIVFKKKQNKTVIQAFDNIILNNIGSQIVLKTMFNDKPIYIDCWASWCQPCIEQMKHRKYLEDKYKNKIHFVYLSFDNDKKSWMKKSKELKLNNADNFLVQNNFKSNFSAYFNIASIPRYIIIGKNNIVVNSNAPRPTNKDALIKILDDLIK